MTEDEIRQMWQSLREMVDAFAEQPSHVVDRYLNQEKPHG